MNNFPTPRELFLMAVAVALVLVAVVVCAMKAGGA